MFKDFFENRAVF